MNKTTKWEISILHSFYKSLKDFDINRYTTEVVPEETHQRLVDLYKYNNE